MRLRLKSPSTGLVWNGCPNCPRDPVVKEDTPEGCIMACSCGWSGPFSACWKPDETVPFGTSIAGMTEYNRPPIAGAADMERESRLDAERVTLEFASKSTRRLDAGKQPISDSPLFSPDGPAQGGLF